MENSYEFGFQLHWYDLFKFLAFIFPIIIYLFSGTIENHRWIRVSLKVISLCLSLLIIWSLFIVPVIEYNTISNAIDSGNCLVIEGEVTNFDTSLNSCSGHNEESFNIGDIHFSYSGTENYGYCKLLCNGGIVTGNGQKLKIVYYVDPATGNNTICSLNEIS